MMEVGMFTQLEWLVRLILAGICGYAIGYERNNRLKEAGVRTHLIVALGSALIMIVSKYGFMDVVNTQGITLDPSRVAAQVISGIGFLGAGMIFVHNQSVNGLTTAAGIWATAGIGMAIGADLYFIGIAATVLILIFQIILHQNFPWNNLPTSDHLQLLLTDSRGISFVQETFKKSHIDILNLKVDREKTGRITMELSIKTSSNFDSAYLMELFEKNDFVQSIKW